MARFAITGSWMSKDGELDYEAGLSRITVPTLMLTSAGDRLQCRPESARRMMKEVASCAHHVILRADEGGPPPDHIGMVTHPGARQAWKHALSWLEGVLPRVPRARG